MGAVAEWRNVNNGCSDSIIEIGTKFFSIDKRSQIPVGRRNHPHIHRNRPAASNPNNFTFLEHSQQTRLQSKGHFSNFIEEQGSTIGDFEMTLALIYCPRECSALVAEELTVDKPIGNRATVNCNEGLVPTWTMPMNGSGYAFLAGSGFALDDDRKIGRRVDRSDFLEYSSQNWVHGYECFSGTVFKGFYVPRLSHGPKDIGGSPFQSSSRSRISIGYLSVENRSPLTNRRIVGKLSGNSRLNINVRTK